MRSDQGLEVRLLAWEALRPHSSGVYANFLSDEGAKGVATAFGDRLARLTELKDRFDPSNFFRMNANIPPSSEVVEPDGINARPGTPPFNRR